MLKRARRAAAMRRAGAAGSGVGQGGGHADELEEEVRGRAARRVRREPHHGARAEDPHVEAAAPPGGAQRDLRLELDALVGVVEVLADVALALEHRSRAPATDVSGRELGPGGEAAARQGLEEADRAVDVAGAERLGILGEEDRLARAVDHGVHGRAEAGHIGGAEAGGGPAEIALDDLEVGPGRHAEGGGDALDRRLAVAGTGQDGDGLAAGEEPARHRAADEAGRAGDQDSPREAARHESEPRARPTTARELPGGWSAGPRQRLA